MDSRKLVKHVSFIIPVPPGAYPTAAIECISRINYPSEYIEILVVEGERPSRQRNAAVSEAEGEILYFLDDDSFITADVLNLGLPYLDTPSVAAVGGPAVTHSDATFLEKCFGEVMGSRCGTFVTRTRNRPLGEARKVRGEELILCNLMMKKSVFLAESGLNEDLYPNEENELLKRLRRSGYEFVYVPEMLVRRTRQASVSGFIKQMFRYGGGRAKHILDHFSKEDFPFFIPTLFSLYLCLLPWARSVWLFLPLFAYLLLLGCGTVSITIRNRSLRLGICAAAFFPVAHVSYGCGLLHGLCRFWNRPRASTASVKIQKVLLSKVLHSESQEQELMYGNL